MSLVPGVGRLAAERRRARPASAISTTTGTSASPASSARPVRRRERSRRRAREVTEPTASPRPVSTTSSRTQQRAELVARVGAGGHRRLVDGEPVLLERPQHERGGGDRASDQRRDGAQAQRHGGHPHGEPDRQRHQRAARVGEHQAHQHAIPSSGHASALSDRRAGAPRGQPHQGGDGERRHQPDQFQYSKGARRRACCSSAASEAGKTLVSSAHSAHQDRAEQDAVQQLRPAAAAASRTSATAPGEHGQVRERPVGLDPRVGGRERPHDRERGVDAPAARTPAPPRCRRGGRGSSRQAAPNSGAAEQHQPDLDVGRRLEPHAAAGDERGEHDHGGHAEAQPAAGSRPRDRHRPRVRAVRDGASAGGERRHGVGRTGSACASAPAPSRISTTSRLVGRSLRMLSAVRPAVPGTTGRPPMTTGPGGALGARLADDLAAVRRVRVGGRVALALAGAGAPGAAAGPSAVSGRGRGRDAAGGRVGPARRGSRCTRRCRRGCSGAPCAARRGSSRPAARRRRRSPGGSASSTPRWPREPRPARAPDTPVSPGPGEASISR